MSLGVKHRPQEGFQIDLEALDSVLDSFVPVALREPRASEGRSSSKGKAQNTALGLRNKRGVSEGRPSTANSDADPPAQPPPPSRRTQLPSAGARPHSANRIVSPSLNSPLASRTEERLTNPEAFLDKENVQKKPVAATESYRPLVQQPGSGSCAPTQALTAKALTGARPDGITFRIAKKIALPEDASSKQLAVKSVGGLAQAPSTNPLSRPPPELAPKSLPANNRRGPAVVDAHVSTLMDAMPSMAGPSGPLGDADFAKDIEYFSDMSKRNSAKALPFAAPPRLSGGGGPAADSQVGATGRRSGSGRRPVADSVVEEAPVAEAAARRVGDPSVPVPEAVPTKRQHPSEARKEAEERRQLATSRVASLAKKSLQEVLAATTNEVSALSVEEPSSKAPVASSGPLSRSQDRNRERKGSRSARTSKTLQEITAELDQEVAREETEDGERTVPSRNQGTATSATMRPPPPLVSDRSPLPQSQPGRATSAAESQSPGRLSSHPYLPQQVEADYVESQTAHPVGARTPGSDVDHPSELKDRKSMAASSQKATGNKAAPAEEDLVFLSPQAILEDPTSRVPVADAKTLRELTEVLRMESQKQKALLHESSNDDVETMPSRSAFQGVASKSYSHGMAPQHKRFVDSVQPPKGVNSSSVSQSHAQVDNSSKKALVRQMRERVIEEQREAMTNQLDRIAEPTPSVAVQGHRDSAAGVGQPQRESSSRRGHEDAYSHASLPRSETGRGSWREPVAVVSVPTASRGALPVPEAPQLTHSVAEPARRSDRSHTTHSRVTERATSTEGASVAPDRDSQSTSQFWSRCALEAERLLETPRSFFDNHLAFLHLCYQQLSTASGSSSREGWNHPPQRGMPSSQRGSSASTVSSVFAPLATTQEVPTVAQMPYPLVIVTSTVFEDPPTSQGAGLSLSREPSRSKLLVALTNLIAGFKALDSNQMGSVCPPSAPRPSSPFRFLAYTEEAVAVAVKDPLNSLKVIVCYITEPVSALALLLNANKVSMDSKGTPLFRVAAWCDMHRPLFHTLRDRVLLLSRYDDGDSFLARRGENEVAAASTSPSPSQALDGFVYYSDLVEGHPLVQRLSSAVSESHVSSSQHGGMPSAATTSGIKPVLWRDLLIRGGISRPHGGSPLMRAHISSFQPTYHYWERKQPSPHPSEFSLRGIGMGSTRVVLARCDPLAALPYLDALFVSPEDGLARYASPAPGFRDEHFSSNPLGRSSLKGNIRVLENRSTSVSMAGDRFNGAPITVPSRSPAANMLEVLRLSAEYKLRVVGTTVFSDASRSLDPDGLTADDQQATSTPDDEMMDVVCRWGYACPTIVVVFYADLNRFSEDFLSFYTKSASLEDALQQQQQQPVLTGSNNNAPSVTTFGQFPGTPVFLSASAATAPKLPLRPNGQAPTLESFRGLPTPNEESFVRPRPGRDIHQPTVFPHSQYTVAAVATPTLSYPHQSAPPMPPQVQYQYPPSAPSQELLHHGRAFNAPHSHAGRDMLRQLVQQRSPQYPTNFPTPTTFLDPYLGMKQGLQEALSMRQIPQFQGHPEMASNGFGPHLSAGGPPHQLAFPNAYEPFPQSHYGGNPHEGLRWG
jgi:hypothetical protein